VRKLFEENRKLFDEIKGKCSKSVACPPRAGKRAHLKNSSFPPLCPVPAGHLAAPPAVRNLLVKARASTSRITSCWRSWRLFRTRLFQGVASGKVLDNAAILLAAAIVSYFLFQRRIFLNKAFFSNFLHIAEFFILG